MEEVLKVVDCRESSDCGDGNLSGKMRKRDCSDDGSRSTKRKLTKITWVTMEEVFKVVDYRESSDCDGNLSGKKRKRDCSDDSSRSTEERKLNKITWDGATFSSNMTYEEYAAKRKEIDEFWLHPPGWDDPNTYKEQCAEICQECFPIIQNKFPEMSDYELVEPLYASLFNGCRIFAHLNFKAKQKGAADSSTSAYFVEYNMVDQDIHCFREIQIDSSSGYRPVCRHCHDLEGADPIGVYIYHPDDTSSFHGAY